MPALVVAAGGVHRWGWSLGHSAFAGGSRKKDIEKTSRSGERDPHQRELKGDLRIDCTQRPAAQVPSVELLCQMSFEEITGQAAGPAGCTINRQDLLCPLQRQGAAAGGDVPGSGRGAAAAALAYLTPMPDAQPDREQDGKRICAGTCPLWISTGNICRHCTPTALPPLGCGGAGPGPPAGAHADSRAAAGGGCGMQRLLPSSSHLGLVAGPDRITRWRRGAAPPCRSMLGERSWVFRYARARGPPPPEEQAEDK